jgi:hypothetical protein
VFFVLMIVLGAQPTPDQDVIETLPRAVSREQKSGGAYRNRTDDILLAKQALSQLS